MQMITISYLTQRINKRTHNLLIHAINNCLPISLLLEKKMH